VLGGSLDAVTSLRASEVWCGIDCAARTIKSAKASMKMVWTRIVGLWAGSFESFGSTYGYEVGGSLSTRRCSWMADVEYSQSKGTYLMIEGSPWYDMLPSFDRSVRSCVARADCTLKCASPPHRAVDMLVFVNQTLP